MEQIESEIALHTFLRVPGGVQHGIWTHLHALWIITESAKIVKATNGGQHEM